MEPMTPAQASQPDQPASIHRRSTNACRRCKHRKIKCHYNSENDPHKCVACSKSYSECLFDAPPDGVLRGQAYVATLEARIKTLERRLRARTPGRAVKKNGPSFTPDTACSEPHDGARDGPAPDHPGPSMDDVMEEEQFSDENNMARDRLTSPLHNDDRMQRENRQYSTQREQLPESFRRSPTERQILGSDITALDMLHSRSFSSNLEGKALPILPPSGRAKALVDTVYFYTQARYCIIDWVQLREWHRDRESIAYISTDGPLQSQIGAFFIWIIYAIGDCLVPNPESSTEEYFARARIYLPAVMGLQNLATVQALLCLTQYYFRGPTESPIWDLVGLALRLCIKLRYHRKTTGSSDAPRISPYTIELQKRFFWCAYCFDRLLGIVSKLPFGISDSDIDVEVPIDVDDTCTDHHTLRELQIKQASGETCGDGNITTMTAALHHLQVYRIRSRILSKFTGPHAQVPSLADVERLLSELDQWRQRAPRKEDSRSFPQQNPDRVQANYFQAVLLLLRPILTGNATDPALIQLCVEFAADACDSAKTLSLNPLTLPDRITVYHCFYGGITLLQCLAIKPTALTPRRAHQAISACLSALAVYTRVLPAVAPFMRLFEDVSNLFVCNDHGSDIPPSSKVRSLLNRIVSSDPSETSQILHSLSHHESQQATLASTPEASLEGESIAVQFDSILGGQSSVVPLEMPLDISPLYAPDAEIMDLWTGPWLDPSSI